MHDPRKLGRRPAKHDARTLRLADYIKGPPSAKEYPAPPSARDWTGPAAPDWHDLLNLQIGDCTVAATGHAIQAWTANHGAEVTPADADILAAYRTVSGYDPAKPETDVGALLLDVMNYWRQTGVAGHKIGAFVSLNPKNTLEMEAAINLFGGVLLGLELPLAAQNQTTWDIAPPGIYHDAAYAPGGWGGHAVYVPAYSRVGWTCVTWGRLKQATTEFGRAYAVEAYAALSEDWVSGATPAPNGFPIDQLRSDLEAITK